MLAQLEEAGEGLTLHGEPSFLLKSGQFMTKRNHYEEQIYQLVEIPSWIKLEKLFHNTGMKDSISEIFRKIWKL